jgi:hypothetical protein
MVVNTLGAALFAAGAIITATKLWLQALTDLRSRRSNQRTLQTNNGCPSCFGIAAVVSRTGLTNPVNVVAQRSSQFTD